MAQLVLDLPDELVARLRFEAEKRQTTIEGFTTQHLANSYPHPAPAQKIKVADLWGAAAGGPGAHGSAEAVDRYIRELRDEWDDR